ncbi:MAG: hypothetical protein OXS35_09565 [Dehalococcoidia bacterium]|nr:hypothetical protein [Dehalococcoidia bacterium]
MEGDVNRHLRMGIDDGNQARGGAFMLVLGDVAHAGVANREYRFKSLDNTGLSLGVTTDGEGRVWLIVGTVSGFKGLTKLYYAHVNYSLGAEEAAKLPATVATHRPSGSWP